MSRVAVYGGAFDPCHIGHLTVITRLLNSNLIDEVWAAPSGERPDKKYTINTSDRLAILKLALEEVYTNEKQVKVIDHHCNNSIGHGTIDLLECLQSKFPEHEFFIAIGSELTKDIPNWHRAPELIAKGRFLIVSRPGSNHEIPNGLSHTIIPNPHNLAVYLSSTELRDMLKKKESISGLVTPSVLRFIKERKLYV